MTAKDDFEQGENVDEVGIELENNINNLILEERYYQLEDEKNNLEKKINQLEDEIDELKNEKDNYHNLARRWKTDYTNLKTRNQQQKEEQNVKMKCDLICKLLPIVDSFERALEAKDGKDEQEFKKGINMIYKQLREILAKEGLEAISAEGEMFDHNYHEAVLQIEDTEAESDTVLEVLEKGYVLGDKVIRPARVIVAK